MATKNEIQTIAAAMHAIRPDWPPRSLATFLEKNLPTRSFHDLAVAGIVVALDQRTKTPHLLLEHGHWWIAATAARGDTNTISLTRAPRCEKEGHGSFLARNCGACKADNYATAAQNAPKRREKHNATPIPEEVIKLLPKRHASKKTRQPDDAA